jgi:hypothetical protein
VFNVFANFPPFSRSPFLSCTLIFYNIGLNKDDYMIRSFPFIPSLTLYKEHVQRHCSRGLLQCKHCSDEMCRGDLAMHEQKCPMFPTSCPGNVVGCQISDARKIIDEHAKACPMAIMAPTFQEQDQKNATLRQQNSQLRELLLGLDSKLEELETNFKDLSTSIKREHRRSLQNENTVPISRLEEITNRVDELATDYNSRLDNATSENARLHIAFMNENMRTQQQFLTMNGSISALRAHIAHLAASRAAGNNASTGATTTAGSSVVPIDSGRREPPKLWNF